MEVGGGVGLGGEGQRSQSRQKALAQPSRQCCGWLGPGILPEVADPRTPNTRSMGGLAQRLPKQAALPTSPMKAQLRVCSI